MVIGYMRVSTDGDRQSTDLQRDALMSAGVDERNIFEDKASGSKDDRIGLTKALEYGLFLNKQGKSPMVLRNSLISDF